MLLKKYKKYRNVQLSKNVEKQIIDNFSVNSITTPGFVNYKKGCTRFTTARDKVYQLLVHGRWFSPGTPASSTTKTCRHDIAEILLKVALKHQQSIKNHCILDVN
jgi:hypothetical protein